MGIKVTKRHDTIGIKQVIRLEWLEKAVALVCSGMNEKTIRKELHEYLAEVTGSGKSLKRGETSRSQVVNMIMNIWVTPDSDLLAFRDSLLAEFLDDRRFSLALNWAMTSFTYLFGLTLPNRSAVYSTCREVYWGRTSISN